MWNPKCRDVKQPGQVAGRVRDINLEESSATCVLNHSLEFWIRGRKRAVLLVPPLRDEKVPSTVLDINLNRSCILRLGIEKVMSEAVVRTKRVRSAQESLEQTVLENLVTKS